MGGYLQKKYWKENDSMKVLFVTNCSYPSSGTGTNIINKLLYDGNLFCKFDKIAVLCGKESPNEKNVDEINGIEVFRTSSYTLFPKKMMGELRKKNIFEYMHVIFEKALFHLEDKLLHNSFGDRFAVKAFYKKLREIDASSYDVIISMSGRYYPSIAVAKYCKRTKTPFIFYQVDPCGSSQYLPEKSLQRRRQIEEEIYQAADYVITTDLIHRDVTEYLSNQLCNKIVELEFPLISEQHLVIGNNKKNNKVICVFSGSIYGGIRDPKYTLDMFRELYKEGIVELHFAGMNAEELNNAEFVKCHGVLPLDEAVKLNASADFLINIGNSVTNQVPSKVFDYISTGKPIINVCKNRNCPTIKYMENYPFAINLYEDKNDFESQVDLLRTFIITNKGKTEQFSNIKEIFCECTPEYCADRLLFLINRLEQ